MDDPRVDHYIEALPAWQQAICRQVRAPAHAADPAVEGEALNEEALGAMFRAIIANNRAGGWRKIKGAG